MRVLDLGCGNGRLIESLKDFRIQYSGIDLSSNLIELARSKYGSQHNKISVDFQVADMLNIPFDDHRLDLVFAIASLYHLPGEKLRRQAVSEIKRVLKPGGHLLMTNWNLWQPKFWPLHYEHYLLMMAGQNKMDWWDLLIPWKNPQGKVLTKRYAHALTLGDLRKLLKRSGFIIEESFYAKKGQKTGVLRGYNTVIVARLKTQ
jgi:SAM-dependent methyltransferase